MVASRARPRHVTSSLGRVRIGGAQVFGECRRTRVPTRRGRSCDGRDARRVGCVGVHDRFLSAAFPRLRSTSWPVPAFRWDRLIRVSSRKRHEVGPIPAECAEVGCAVGRRFALVGGRNGILCNEITRLLCNKLDSKVMCTVCAEDSTTKQTRDPTSAQARYALRDARGVRRDDQLIQRTRRNHQRDSTRPSNAVHTNRATAAGNRRDQTPEKAHSIAVVRPVVAAFVSAAAA